MSIDGGEEDLVAVPEIVSAEQWRAARLALLAEEKALTRARDRLNETRRRLPMVEVKKRYPFTGARGEACLLDLFGQARQLIVVHFMFDPRWENGCPSCTASADEISDGLLRHLRDRDTTLVHVSRAPFAKLDAYRQRRGWTFSWFSSCGSEFNYDFGVTLDEAAAPLEYNYRSRREHEAAGTDYYFAGDPPYEEPGISCFLRSGRRVFHTYSTFGRGGEGTGGAYYWLDLTALGRQEEWEQPAGRVRIAREANPDFAA